MRTTVTLDPDVAASLKSLARERNISFKQALNTSIRKGLADRSKPTRRVKLAVHSLNLRPGIDLNQALQLASQLEDLEIKRKLELRK